MAIIRIPYFRFRFICTVNIHIKYVDRSALEGASKSYMLHLDLRFSNENCSQSDASYCQVEYNVHLGVNCSLKPWLHVNETFLQLFALHVATA